MNKYKKAIERNEVRDFLFGYGEYYHHDRDWGTHDNISTFIDILEYGEEIGRNELSEQFDADIIAILETNEIGLEEFGDLLCFVRYSFISLGGKRPFNWIPSERLRELYRQSYVRKVKDLNKIGNDNCEQFSEELHELYRLNNERINLCGEDYLKYYNRIITELKNRFNYYLIDDAPYERNDKTTLSEVPQDIVGEYIVPEGVTRISNYAFDGCRHITSVKMPDSVRSIEWYAFKDCISLESVSISPNVDFIGDGAFKGCSKLKSLFIPANVRILYRWALDECTSLSKIEVAEDNKYFASKDCMLYSKDMANLIMCPSKIETHNLVIPEGVVSIKSGAIYECPEIRSIHFPASIKAIEMSSIYDCTKLREIHFCGKEISSSKMVIDGLLNLDRKCKLYVPSETIVGKKLRGLYKICRVGSFS